MSDDIGTLQSLVEALRRKLTAHGDRLEALETENDQLRERIAELEQVVDPDPGSVEYEQLTRPRKVHRVRKALAENAANSHTGKASMEYSDVIWLFDGQPSAGHAYDLMELAAELDGYSYDEPNGGGQKRVRVNLEAVNDETMLHAANNAVSGGRV